MIVYDSVEVVTLWMPGWGEQTQTGGDGDWGDHGHVKGKDVLRILIPSTPWASRTWAAWGCALPEQPTPGKRTSS